jgi:hypothetical protein
MVRYDAMWQSGEGAEFLRPEEKQLLAALRARFYAETYL